MSYDFQEHWDLTYKKNPLENLGWYEEDPKPSLELILKCNLVSSSVIFNAGAGASTLINKLIGVGYENIIINDISASALAEMKSSLKNTHDRKLRFIVDDLTNPTELTKIKEVDLWHDRAVLHFFIEEEQQKAYFDLLKSVVKTNGYVILAEFNKDGARSCSGLKVLNYDAEMLQEKLGDEFKLLEAFNHTFVQPSGNTREFVYTLFKRTG